MEELKKLVEITPEGIRIIDEDFRAEVERKNLSASMVSSFMQCPADWLMDSFILRKIEHVEPAHFERGHIFHKSMEAFYALPKDERTDENLNKCISKVITDDYAHVTRDNETLEWARNAVKGYIKLGLSPKDADVAMIVKNKEPKDGIIKEELGIELFVKGKLSDTERQIVGFVDMVLENETGLTILDWKTGKKIAPFDPSKPIGPNNDFGYWRQQLTYTMLMEQDGFNVTEAQLAFPIADGMVDIDVFNEDLRKQVIEDYEKVDKYLSKCLEENLFPYKSHFFCKWCGTLNPHLKSPRFKLQINRQELVQLVEWSGFE